MLRRSMMSTDELRPNVTPLIDVMMVLVIFFMLVVKIGVIHGDGGINLPSTAIGTKIVDTGNTLILNVFKGGSEPLVTAMLDQDDSLPKEFRIKTENGDKPLECALKAAKAHNKDVKIIILANSDVPYEQLEQVLVTAATARVTEINFQTKQATTHEGEIK